jgi:RNA polymerase sigma factor (sigma-70 family)
VREALDEYADGFFAGEPGALGRVYAVMHSFLCNVALKAGAECETDAEDAASEAILYVQGWEKRRPGTTGGQLFGMLTWATKIMVRRQCAASGRTIPFSTQEGDGEDLEFVEDLEGVEERRLLEGADPHEYLTSIDTDTPEEIALQGNMREFIERKAVAACGQRAWDIYYASVVTETPQSDVAEQYDVSQQRVSQVVREVQVALKAALLEGA